MSLTIGCWSVFNVELRTKDSGLERMLRHVELSLQQCVDISIPIVVDQLYY
jgi:hypothetical protein